MQLLIVEGIDRIGKTTFINRLESILESLGKDVILDLHQTTWVPDIPLNKKPHCYEYTNAFTMSYFLEVMGMFKHKKDMVMIVDRYHASTVAYGLIKRRELIKELYGTYSHFLDTINGFETELLRILGSENVHYIQFFTEGVGIPDTETEIEELIRVNYKFIAFFENSIIPSKYLLHLDSDTNYQTNIMTHIPFTTKLLTQ